MVMVVEYQKEKKCPDLWHVRNCEIISKSNIYGTDITHDIFQAWRTKRIDFKTTSIGAVFNWLSSVISRSPHI